MSSLPGSTISAILRHDSKVTSYKIALLRAINDVVLAFPDLASGEQAVAIPLRKLADRWITYYWPFVDPQAPILQGPVSQRDGQTRHDMSFRGELARLYSAWEQFIDSTVQPSDGYLLVADMRVERLREQLLPQVLAALKPASLLWLTFPKGTSKIQTDLTRDVGWDALQQADLKWVTLISVDPTWSAFCLRPYKPGEARQSFR